MNEIMVNYAELQIQHDRLIFNLNQLLYYLECYQKVFPNIFSLQRRVEFSSKLRDEFAEQNFCLQRHEFSHGKRNAFLPFKQF